MKAAGIDCYQNRAWQLKIVQVDVINPQNTLVVTPQNIPG